MGERFLQGVVMLATLRSWSLGLCLAGLFVSPLGAADKPTDKPAESPAKPTKADAAKKQVAPKSAPDKSSGDSRKKAAKPTAAKQTAAKTPAADKPAAKKSPSQPTPAKTTDAKTTDVKKGKAKARAVAAKKGAAKNAGAKPQAQLAKTETPAQAKAAMAEKSAEEAAPEQAKFTPFPRPAELPDPGQVAAELDQLLEANLKQAGVELAPPSGDEDFLRRVSFDLAGIAPSPEEVTLFGIDPDPDKRALLIDRLLRSDAYAENWARYWRDVLYARAVEQRARLGQQAFETWMAEQLKQNQSWADITTRLITATGDVSKEGSTALIYAQRAEPDEVASEVSRVFLGIQLQCANCHDHPSDQWKRDQFHALAAFFPRMFVRPIPGEKRTFAIASFTPDRRTGDPRADFARMISQAEDLVARLDRDSDGAVSEGEAKKAPGPFLARLFQQGDADKDGKLTADEIRKIPPPPLRGGRGTAEYFMPDLQNPQSAGTRFDPKFFLNDTSPGTGLTDVERRVALARYITAPENPWFAKAFVNRLWAQLMGEGFVMPVDDMGPERTPRHPEVLDALAAGFTASGYDVKWLLKTIANTEAYQRRIRPRAVSENPPAFASACPTKLRADQLYDAITRILGVEDLGGPANRGQRKMAGRYNDSSARGQFRRLFGFDPSASPEDQQGNLLQALFLMNSPAIHNLIAGKGATRLATILSKHSSNEDALRELYLLVHAREPSANELEICGEYLKDVGNRQDAFEDILWSLINSTEFQTRR
ncbi:MAG: DUF1549 domain-containing protein [Planctomycetaceae bacterium]